MSEKTEGLKTIWYFVGIVLMVMGGLVFLAGIIDSFYTLSEETVLAHLYPGIWWGGIMFLAGLLFLLKNKDKVVN
jgi:hypothetical protein